MVVRGVQSTGRVGTRTRTAFCYATRHNQGTVSNESLEVGLFRTRGKGPSLKQVSGNVFSEKLPSGNLISALHDRELMTWSDRGGASRYFGDCWSDAVTSHLRGQVGVNRTLSDEQSFRLDAVIRLDDDPRIAIQAGRHKLTNPDFVLFGRTSDQRPILQAADSKFSVDTIKPAQVSAEALQALLDVENGLVRAALEQDLHDHDVATASVERGIFVSPVGPLTDFFLPRVLSDPRSDVDVSDIELIEVGPIELFGGLDEAALIGPLALVDRLGVSPRTHLLSAMYYLRVACACAWMWVEERTPLLSLSSPPSIDWGSLMVEVQDRSRTASSAFEVAESWFTVIEEITRNRKALNDMMSLPVRMSEIRDQVVAAGFGENRRVVKMVRAGLDRRYRERLIEEVGEIPSEPEQPLPAILQLVASASRSLRPEMRQLTLSLIAEQAPSSDS